MTTPEIIALRFRMRSSYNGTRLTGISKAIEAAYLAGLQDGKRGFIPAKQPSQITKPDTLRDWNSLSAAERTQVFHNWKRR